MNYGCEGKVAFISGGTSGIGKAVAELLLKDGAEVWLLGRDAEKGTEAAVTLSAYGKVHYVQGDVKDLEACRSAAQNVREQRENIDLIVNAAGIYQERRLEKVTEYDFFSIMDTNVKGTIFFDADLAASAGVRGGEHREHCFRRGDQWQLWLSAVLRVQGRCRSVYESAGLGSGAAGTGQLYLPGRCGDADAGQTAAAGGRQLYAGGCGAGLSAGTGRGAAGDRACDLLGAVAVQQFYDGQYHSRGRRPDSEVINCKCR